MLASSPAETGQGVAGCVVALALGQRPDWPAHRLVSDGNEAHGHLLLTHHLDTFVEGVDLGGESVEGGRGPGLVQRLVLRLAEDLWKVLGQDTAEAEVGVSDC